jgi:hypothetical protein
LWQGGADSDHRQPNDYLQERRDPINKLSQREALAAKTNVIARVVAPVHITLSLRGQRLIPAGERSGLWTHIGAVESVSLCVQMKY